MTHKPSYAPVLMAFGLMFTLWGAVTTWVVSAAGIIIVGFAGLRWSRDARHEPTGHVASLETQPERAARATVKPETASRRETLMASPGLHRSAILLAFFTFVLVITGALVESSANSPAPFLQQIHLATAAAVGILIVGLAFGLRGPAWLLLAAVALQAVLGIWRNATIGTLHALLAQLIFAGTVALALITTPSWRQPPEPLDDSPRLSLRKLSVVTLVLLIVQVSLGAAYRHQAMGVVPHIGNALIVTIAILLTAVLVNNQYPEHRALRPVAKTLIGITFAQVMLGMAAFITRLMMAQGTLPVVIIGVTHVATGALTLATMTLLCLMLRHYLRPATATPPRA